MPLANAERDYGRRHPPNGVRRDKNFSFGGWMRSCGQAGAERRPGSSENCRLRHDDAARQRLQFMLSVMCADGPRIRAQGRCGTAGGAIPEPNRRSASDHAGNRANGAETGFCQSQRQAAIAARVQAAQVVAQARRISSTDRQLQMPTRIVSDPDTCPARKVIARGRRNKASPHCSSRTHGCACRSSGCSGGRHDIGSPQLESSTLLSSPMTTREPQHAERNIPHLRNKCHSRALFRAEAPASTCRLRLSTYGFHVWWSGGVSGRNMFSIVGNSVR